MGTNDTINFAPAVASQTITTTQGELEITKDMSINPGGGNTTIDANQASRAINITSGVSGFSATLNQLTITGGVGRGGGIYIDSGEFDLTLTNSAVSGNTGSGIGLGNQVSVSLTNSTVSGNSGSGIGLGNQVSVSLTNSTVSGNSGVRITGAYASLTLTSSTVSGNSSGGIYMEGGDNVLTNSTVSGNTDAGIFAQYSDIIMKNSIVANNPGYYGDCFSSSYNCALGRLYVNNKHNSLRQRNCCRSTVRPTGR